MSIPAFSVRNHVLVNMLMVVILMAGSVFALTLVREMFPESRPDKLLISVIYPGVQPEEIEKAVTIRLEEAVRDIEGIEKIDSMVAEGTSMTVLTLLSEVDDIDALLQEVRNDINAVEDLPDELEQLTVRKMEPRLPVISVAIFGQGSEAELKNTAHAVRDDLLTLPGVSTIEITGTRDDEISIEVQPDRLLKYDVTFAEIAQAVRESNVDISGGQLKGDRSSIAVRTLGEETRGLDLKNIVVRTRPDGQRILLSDITVIRDTFVESDLEALYNNQPAVHCIVYKADSEDVIRISSVVKAWVAGKTGEDFSGPGPISGAIRRLLGQADLRAVYEQSRRNPFEHSFDIDLHTDFARFVEGRLELLTRNGRFGLVLVLCSLMLFLNFRVALCAAVGLVVSFMGSFFVMWMFGVSVNLLTMFGLIIVLGLIVDDAIVIGENIFRHVEGGTPPVEAAIRGTEEVMWPVIVAVATSIGAFCPLFFVRGQIGDFMRQLPLVVIAALSISLLEALVILPAHLSSLPSPSQLTSRGAAKGRVRRFFERLGAARQAIISGWMMVHYERLLRRTLHWRYVTIAFALSALTVAVGLVAGGFVERTFIQKMDSESLICNVEMPIGTSAEILRRQIDRLTSFIVDAQRFPEVMGVQSFIARQYDLMGSGEMPSNDQAHLGQLVIELCPADERQRSSTELLGHFRSYSLDELDGVNSVVWDEMSGGPGGRDILIRVTGRNFEDVSAVAAKLKTVLAGYEGVFDLDDDLDVGKREIRLRLRDSARPTGITVGMLGAHVRGALYGHESRRITRNREDVRIMVRYPKAFRRSVYNLESMWIPTAGPAMSRGWVPLGEVAELTDDRGYTTINRSRQQRAVTIFGSVDRESAEPGEIVEVVRETFAAEISGDHPGVQLEFLGQYEELLKSFGSLKLAFPAALILIYGMLASLFRSYLQPFVVMSAIPFGFLGAVVGHWVTGNPLTILSWIGMVALTGILVNDSLVLVVFINRRIDAGQDHLEASVQGATLRLRAILLTTLTTVAGLTPLMFETSFQAKFLIPMAVTLTFGLVFATALTLVIVPAFNMIFLDLTSARVRAVRWLLSPRNETKSTSAIV